MGAKVVKQPPRRKRTKSEQFRREAFKLPTEIPNLPATADYHRVEKKFARSNSERTPVPIVQDADRIATEIFDDKLMGGRDTGEGFEITSEKPFNEELMSSLHSAVLQVVLLLEQYNRASLSIKKRYKSRVKEIWDELPKLATIGRKAAAKVAGIGIFSSIWGAVYLAIDQYVSQPIALIITAGVAFAGFFAANRTTVKILASGCRISDDWFTRAHMGLVRWLYSRKKVDKLQALATVVRSEIHRVNSDKPPTKEERKRMKAEIKEQDKSIEALCSTLPNPREPKNPDYEISG